MFFSQPVRWGQPKKGAADERRCSASPWDTPTPGRHYKPTVQDLCKIYQRSATSLHFSDTLENEWTWGWTPESDKFQGISFSVRGPWWGSMFVFVVNRTYVLYSIQYQGDGARASGQIKSKVHMSRHFLPPEVYEQLRLFKSHCLRRSSAHISQNKNKII